MDSDIIKKKLQIFRGVNIHKLPGISGGNQADRLWMIFEDETSAFPFGQMEQF